MLRVEGKKVDICFVKWDVSGHKEFIFGVFVGGFLEDNFFEGWVFSGAGFFGLYF